MSKPILAREFSKKTFYQSGVKKTLDGWAAYFTIGNQSFTLADTETKKQALFFERMIKAALITLIETYTKYHQATVPLGFFSSAENNELLLIQVIQKFLKNHERSTNKPG